LLVWGPVARAVSIGLLLLAAVRFAVKGRPLPWFNQWTWLQWFGHGLAVAFLLVLVAFNLALFVLFL
jgi:uncharacterized membrane protein